MMAGLQLQKKSKKNEDGVGSMVDFLLANARLVLGVGGAAMLGIATLAVKRLIDRAASPPDEKEPEEKAEQKSMEETWKEAVLIKVSPRLSRKVGRSDLSAPLPLPAPSQPSPVEKPLSTKEEVKKISVCFTLQERLLDYYTHHANVSDTQRQLVRQLVLDIMTELQNFLRAKHPEMPFSAMRLGGSLGRGLPVANLDHSCLMLPLVLESELWKFIPGQETILSDPQFWLVKRVDLEYTVRGSSPWDKFIVGRYLSSRTIIETLHKTLLGSINWPSIGAILDCTIQPVIASDNLKLEVSHAEGRMIINILPMATTKDVVLFAHSHPNAPVENLWHRSYYKEEIHKLQELDNSDSGVRQQCLHILKGICRGNASLSHLSSTHLRHTILHLSSTSNDWSEASLDDRFLQVIEQMIIYLDKGFLPCYFNNNVNLFYSLSEQDIDDLGYGLYQLFSEPDSLLQK
ncbi:mitochondrial dynamics protein MID49 [Bombina bombina]|uniref:mitochondrial dynamics protein MID49 n=1 Tax=Bombina bombina TaxID=8345 RepID=UPI00235ACA29|nr:mitochondrial dynamics protein MID49 [Bombina bombina]XP_053551212.1 mitochondrial dynamics protein MID49 [Bombina bombina]XP_053551213.1 mitochondrial dynamics protein MID49 [Bombina bombina]XP_053551214.1 mitochondrial dynamics protein MID49 [Bombina bombina]